MANKGALLIARLVELELPIRPDLNDIPISQQVGSLAILFGLLLVSDQHSIDIGAIHGDLIFAVNHWEDLFIARVMVFITFAHVTLFGRTVGYKVDSEMG